MELYLKLKATMKIGMRKESGSQMLKACYVSNILEGLCEKMQHNDEGSEETYVF